MRPVRRSVANAESLRVHMGRMEARALMFLQLQSLRDMSMLQTALSIVAELKCMNRDVNDATRYQRAQWPSRGSPLPLLLFQCTGPLADGPCRAWPHRAAGSIDLETKGRMLCNIRIIASFLTVARCDVYAALGVFAAYNLLVELLSQHRFA